MCFFVVVAKGCVRVEGLYVDRGVYVNVHVLVSNGFAAIVRSIGPSECGWDSFHCEVPSVCLKGTNTYGWVYGSSVDEDGGVDEWEVYLIAFVYLDE